MLLASQLHDCESILSYIQCSQKWEHCTLVTKVILCIFSAQFILNRWDTACPASLFLEKLEVSDFT